MGRIRYGLVWIGETLGISVGVATLMMLFKLLGNVRLEEMGMWREIVTMMFPLYLLVTGIFVISVTTVGYFQTSANILLSMNCTRKACVVRILVLTVTELCVLIGAAFAMWALGADPILSTGEDWMKGISLCAGAGLGLCALFITMGVAAVRWGKVGMTIAIVFYMIVGGGFGAAFASGVMGDLNLQKLDAELVGKVLDTGAIVLFGGAALYAVSGIFAFMAMRKSEVRV